MSGPVERLLREQDLEHGPADLQREGRNEGVKRGKKENVMFLFIASGYISKSIEK